MIKKNKIISLTIIGLVVGVILGMVGIGGEAGVLQFASLGGIIGFIAGWIWQSKSGDAEK